MMHLAKTSRMWSLLTPENIGNEMVHFLFCTFIKLFCSLILALADFCIDIDNLVAICSKNLVIFEKRHSCEASFVVEQSEQFLFVYIFISFHSSASS